MHANLSRTLAEAVNAIGTRVEVYLRSGHTLAGEASRVTNLPGVVRVGDAFTHEDEITGWAWTLGPSQAISADAGSDE